MTACVYNGGTARHQQVEQKDQLTYKDHHDPDRMDRQVPLFGVRVQQV